MRFTVLIACLLLTYANIALAVDSITPKQIVEALYKPYLDNPYAQKLEELDALNLILPYASHSLEAAIRKNEECERLEQGICNIDFDIIVNAQDWDLSKFSLQEKNKNSLPVISATFLNGAKNKVTYYFIREGNNWKIDEVEAIRYKDRGGVEYHHKLKQELIR